MTLPVKPLATDTLALEGTDVDFRSLSRAEVVKLADMEEDTDAAEVFILSRSTGCTEAEAVTWRETTDAATVGTLLNAIAVLSGLRRGEA